MGRRGLQLALVGVGAVATTFGALGVLQGGRGVVRGGTVSANVAFDPYPIITAVSQAKGLTLPIAGLSVPGTVQWTTTMAITGTVISVAGSIEITGTVTITNGPRV